MLLDDFGPDSDVHLVATYAPEVHWSLLDRVRMKLELESLLGCRVDLLNRRALGTGSDRKSFPGIPLAVVESVLGAPEQKVPEHGDVVCYQSKVEINGKLYLVRVMVNEMAAPQKGVTVYRTSKINKYWKATT